MVKVTGPLMSVRAGGKFADTLIYAQCKGTQYVKQYHVPSQPHSPAQTITRLGTAALAKAWYLLTAVQQNAWEPYALKWHLSNYHAYLKENCQRWQDWRPFLPTPQKAYVNPVDWEYKHYHKVGNTYTFHIRWYTPNQPFLTQIAMGWYAGFTPTRNDTIILLPTPDVEGYLPYAASSWTAPDSGLYYFKTRLMMASGNPLPIVGPWLTVGSA